MLASLVAATSLAAKEEAIRGLNMIGSTDVIELTTAKLI